MSLDESTQENASHSDVSVVHAFPQQDSAPARPAVEHVSSHAVQLPATLPQPLKRTH